LLMSQASSAREAVLRQVEGVLQSAGRMIQAKKVEDAAKLLKSLPKEVLRSPRVQTAVIMLDDERNDVLYRHVGRAYALLNSDPSASKAIALRVGAASGHESDACAFAHALDARIRH
jgi:hypothetical protein